MRYGCGEIEQRGARFRVRSYVEGKRTPLGTYATETEARSILDGLAALRAQGDVAGTGATLRSYGVKWLDRRETDGKRAIDTDRGRWERYVVPEAWAGLPLREIGKRDLRDWLSSMRRRHSTQGKPLSPQTILHCFKLVSTCLRSAMEDELIEKNPATGLRIERPRPSPSMWTFLTVEEQRMLAMCELPAGTERERQLMHGERLMALIAMGTGIRQGEQWNLELRDVHVDDAEPWLFVRWGSAGQAPKNGKVRRVPLFGLALAAMKEWLRLRPSYMQRCYSTELVFPTERGRRRNRKAPRRWPLILRAAKLGDRATRHDKRPVRWHDLRHTCASSLVAAWWGPAWRLELVREVLGHSSITVTERYAHLAASVLDEAGAQTSGLAMTDVMVPAAVPGPTAADPQTPCYEGRDTQDSNLRPPASEAGALSN